MRWELLPFAREHGRSVAEAAWLPAAGVAAGQHPSHPLDPAALLPVVVEVAALRALHAGRAARLAAALGDEPEGVVDEALEDLVPATRDPDSARMTVVDEDRRLAGLVVDVGREPADVPAIAHREQRQDRD